VDITQLTLPSYRGRVTEIRLDSHEGGLNLNMPPDVVRALTELGQQAAELFDDFDLDAHQRSRFQASMAALDDLVTELAASAAAGFDAVISSTPPKRRSAAADQLVQLGQAWTDCAGESAGTAHPGAQGYRPHPVGDLRILPRQ
jgi:hypothetical protein